MTVKTDEAYSKLKKTLLENGFVPGEEKKISYGMQFRVNGNLFRIFESRKKGVRLDTSTSKNDELNSTIESMFSLSQRENLSSSDFSASATGKDTSEKTDADMGPLGVHPPLAGSDEVGKGDFFAPLIAGCVYLDKREYEILKTLGVRDSKALTDGKIAELAQNIRQVTGNYSMMSLGHAAYNRLYKKTKNINVILADAHVKAIHSVYEKHPFNRVLIDRFGQEQRLRTGLSDLDLEVNIFVRAEENIAVAAASILARDMLLKYMKKMEEKYRMGFPLGAGEETLAAGRAFVKKYGKEELSNVCKMHFKNADKILERSLQK